MGGSAKKVVKKAATVAVLGPTAAVGLDVAKNVKKKYEKEKAEEKQRDADNAILTKEVESTNAAARAYEAEQKKKEKRQMGLGSAISGSESSLG
jgi:acetyl-CoA carboxylase carboxyltransferase component